MSNPHLSNDFVFTSLYDYRIDRDSYFKRCWPRSEQSPSYEIEKMPERDSKAFIPYDCKIKNDGSSRNTEVFTIEGNKIRSRSLPWVCPKGTSVNNDCRNLR